MCVGGLLEQLEEEYGRRERLWIDFQKSVDALGTSLLSVPL
jgi:hypothetical protein